MAVWDGIKTYELRKDDRGFEVGSLLDLHEWNPITKKFTGRHVVAKVTHLLKHGEFPGLEEGFVIMSLLILNKGTLNED